MKLDQQNGMIITDVSMWEWLRNLHLSKNMMSLNGVHKVGGSWNVVGVGLQSLNAYANVFE